MRLGNRPFLSLSLSTTQKELSAVNCFLHQPCPFVRDRFDSCKAHPLEPSPATHHTSFRGSGGQGFQAINRASFCSSRFLSSRMGKGTDHSYLLKFPLYQTALRDSVQTNISGSPRQVSLQFLSHSAAWLQNNPPFLLPPGFKSGPGPAHSSRFQPAARAGTLRGAEVPSPGSAAVPADGEVRPERGCAAQVPPRNSRRRCAPDPPAYRYPRTPRAPHCVSKQQLPRPPPSLLTFCRPLRCARTAGRCLPGSAKRGGTLC